jgi:anti-sigma B factor antagonist
VGLSLLVQYHQVGVRQGTPLRVVAPARNPLRALRATMLDQTLNLYPTVPEAVAAPPS